MTGAEKNQNINKGLECSFPRHPSVEIHGRVRYVSAAAGRMSAFQQNMDFIWALKVAATFLSFSQLHRSEKKKRSTSTRKIAQQRGSAKKRHASHDIETRAAFCAFPISRNFFWKAYAGNSTFGLCAAVNGSANRNRGWRRMVRLAWVEHNLVAVVMMRTLERGAAIGKPQLRQQLISETWAAGRMNDLYRCVLVYYL